MQKNKISIYFMIQPLSNPDMRCSYNSFLQACLHVPNLLLIAKAATLLGAPTQNQRKIVSDMESLQHSSSIGNFPQNDKACRDAYVHFEELEKLINASAQAVSGSPESIVLHGHVPSVDTNVLRSCCFTFDINTLPLRDIVHDPCPRGWEIFSFVINVNQGHFIALTQQNNGSWAVYNDDKRVKIHHNIWEAIEVSDYYGKLGDLTVDTTVLFNSAAFRSREFAVFYGGKKKGRSTKLKTQHAKKKSKKKSRRKRSKSRKYLSRRRK